MNEPLQLQDRRMISEDVADQLPANMLSLKEVRIGAIEANIELPTRNYFKDGFKVSESGPLPPETKVKCQAATLVWRPKKLETSWATRCCCSGRSCGYIGRDRTSAAAFSAIGKSPSL